MVPGAENGMEGDVKQPCVCILKTEEDKDTYENYLYCL